MQDGVMRMRAFVTVGGQQSRRFDAYVSIDTIGQ
jgi:hypothetical protein